MLIPAAVGIFLVALADGILTARAYAGKRGEHVDAAQELVALGAANAAAGLSQGMNVGVSVSRTAVNDTVGARSQLSGLLAAGTIVLVLLFLTDPIADLPKAVLGAAIVGAAVGLIDVSSWRALAATDRVEVAIAGVTTTLVLISGVLEAVSFAVGLSVIDVVRRSAKPHDAVLGFVPRLGRYGDVSVHRTAQVTPGVVVYRLDDRLFFANAGYVKGRVKEAIRGAPTHTHTLVFDAEGLTEVDSAGIDAVVAISRSLEDAGITLLVARMKTPVEQKLRDAIADRLPPECFYGTVHAAVDAAVSRRAARTRTRAPRAE